ncbi:hypothetical protein KAK07_12375 [Ideonella sp. 4Y16]|uniref:Hydrogenase formation protein n=1 Tax=Ideonella alba TaxID=2824118 RepID=A0A940YFS2_9BURK|nr:hypothetical protein [Ideonella alba]MBQ0931692.1 hypothetical protein [Ideonella alba]MBQ0944131.1 hypothetical protein [Ideonella alba]
MIGSAVDLVGRLRLLPGRQPALDSSRRDWLPALAAGRLAADLPALVGALFSLCGHAHRWAAQAAVQAAAGQAPVPDVATRRAHRAATLKDQLLRLYGDWPRWLPDAPQEQAAALVLRGCPLWRETAPLEERLAELPGWLATQALGRPLAEVLLDSQSDPVGWAWHWAAQGRTPLARLLDSQRPARQLATPGPALDLLADAATTLPRLATLMREPGFAMRPHWQGAVPDTGPWSRLGAPLPAASAGDRLVARLVETLRLAGPQGEAMLSMGALTLGPHEGLAWVEMARGLLVHRVQLEPGADGPRVVDARVLAPTEWNVHPQGNLACALAQLDPADARSAARLAVAFDPCVAFEVQPPMGPHNRPRASSPDEDKRCMS